MKYVNEFRDAATLRQLSNAIAREQTRPWTIMEVCGGQTHAIARYALHDLLPNELSLVHGPGCPVCVTPLEVVERARRIALLPDVTLCTFGDMLRVPGSDGDLLDARARGADVRVVTSPVDAVRLAQATPERAIVFFGVGFETTAPATAMAADLAQKLDLANFSLLALHVLVPPALELILSAPDCQIDGFLAAGHVCTVTGVDEYPAIAARFKTPIVVTGFEPVDILQGVLMTLRQLESGRHEVEIQYERCVRPEGNPVAWNLVNRVFQVSDACWRGIGTIPQSGMQLRDEYARWNALERHPVTLGPIHESPNCRAALVLQGALSPVECPEFGKGCTPDSALGAPMVSSEGACAAYYRYRRHNAGSNDQQDEARKPSQHARGESFPT